MIQSKIVSDEFLDYIVASEKTKLTVDQLFEIFVNEGFYDRCQDSLTDDLQEVVKYWDDNGWKLYIYNYLKLQFNNKVSLGETQFKHILA